MAGTMAVQCVSGIIDIFEVESLFHPTELVAITEEFNVTGMAPQF